jgi:hypothetical protein
MNDISIMISSMVTIIMVVVLCRIHEYLRDMLVIKYEKCKSCNMRTQLTCILCGFCWSCHWKNDGCKQSRSCRILKMGRQSSPKKAMNQEKLFLTSTSYEICLFTMTWNNI